MPDKRGVAEIPATAVTRLPAAQAIVGESIRWLPRQNCLIYVDILGKELRRFDPDTGDEHRWPMDQLTGCCVETSAPKKILLAQETQIALFDLISAEVAPWCPLEAAAPDTRGNDGRVAPDGHFWISTMNMVTEPRPPVGNLYSVTPNRDVVQHMGGLRIPNALAFSPRGDRMYFADSPNRAVWQFDRDLTSGHISNKRLFFAFGTNEHGIPDGASVDTDGCYWIAVAQKGARVERRRPDGRLDMVIRLAADNATMCAFGGPQRDQLYITTLSKHIPPKDRINHPDQGALFTVKTGHQGLPETPFPLGGPLQ